MNKLFLLLACMACMGVSGQEIKKWKATDLDSYIRNADHPLVVSFWATYCEPCNKEIPYFQQAVARYKDQQVEMLLVSLDLPDYYPEKISRFVKTRGYAASLIWLDETNADYFCPVVDKSWSGGIPATLFINNKTHYRRFYDRQLTEAQVEPELKKLTAASAD